MENIVFSIAAVMFLAIMYFSLSGFKTGAVFFEDFYAKEIVFLINRAEPGMEVVLDVTKMSEIAVKKGRNPAEMISFNNVDNTVTVSLREGRGMLYKFFNNVDITDWRIEQLSGGAETNRLFFKVVGEQRQDDGA